MAPRRKKPRNSRIRLPGWSAISPVARQRVTSVGLTSLAVVVVAVGASSGFGKLDSHVDRLLLQEYGESTFTFVNLPEVLLPLARADLEASIAPYRERSWTEISLCEEVAHAVNSVGWIRRIDSVRRLAAGEFEIHAEYRTPAALVQLDDYFLLIDRQATRLPGRYTYDPRWPVLQGVAASAPDPGESWSGDDVLAGLATLNAIRGESFSSQVTGVLVHNFGGRRDPRMSHVELATDRAGGRIRWGSAPGQEIEENLVTHKLAILRQNYATTGRLDAGFPVIDVSTFPDRFTVPK